MKGNTAIHYSARINGYIDYVEIIHFYVGLLTKEMDRLPI